MIGKIVGNRISAEDEVAGADLGEMGVLGYDFGSGPTTGVASRAPAASPAGAKVPSLAESR